MHKFNEVKGIGLIDKQDYKLIVVTTMGFLAVFCLIVATINDYGLTWDEKCYIDNANSIDIWFRQLGSGTTNLSYESVNRYWNSEWKDDLTGNVHPPFIKLSAIVFRHVLGTSLFENIVYQYRVSTAFWTSVLVMCLFLVIRRLTTSYEWGLLGGLTFLAVPRFFAEGHLYATDMVVSSLGFMGLSVFMFAARPWTRVVLGGVVVGAALATKFSGLLSFVIIGAMVIVVTDKKRFFREYFLMVLFASFFFALFNLPLLFNPVRELSIYFSSFLNREAVAPVTTLYFGQSYDFRLPIVFPWIMFGITLPPVLVITGLVGFVIGIWQFMSKKDVMAYFSVVPFLVLMVVYMQPGTPKHDGIRLFSSVWPFVVMMSIYGCYRIQSFLPHGYKIGMIISALGLIVAASVLAKIHPYELSYYNKFIGGTKGAEDRGFIVSYWYDAFNRNFMSDISRVTESRAAGIYSYPNDRVVAWNQEYGFLPYKLQPVPQDGDYRYLLILNRVLTPEMRAYLGRCTPLLILKTWDGAFLGGLYDVTSVQTK